MGGHPGMLRWKSRLSQVSSETSAEAAAAQKHALGEGEKLGEGTPHEEGIDDRVRWQRR